MQNGSPGVKKIRNKNKRKYSSDQNGHSHTEPREDSFSAG